MSNQEFLNKIYDVAYCILLPEVYSNFVINLDLIISSIEFEDDSERI